MNAWRGASTTGWPGQPQGAVFEPEVVAALLEDDGFETSVVVFDADARIIGATKAVERTSGYRADALVGRTFTDLVEPAHVATERENFARLAGGELDYHDLHADRRAIRRALGPRPPRPV